MELETTKRILAALERMKKDTVRPKDWSDADALRRKFRLEEG